MTVGLPTNVTAGLASALVKIGLEDIPGRVVERAKYVMLDGLACGLVGAQLPWSQVATRAVASMDGNVGSSCVWGWDTSLSPTSACLLNATYIQGFELDDYHPLGPLHSQSVVLPPALSVAEAFDVNGQGLLRAVILGFEVGPRLGMAMDGFDMIARGWHGGAVYGTVAAAVAAALTRGCVADELVHAMSIAGAQAGGLMGAQYDAMVKPMQHGFAARNGLLAAALATGGYTGMSDVLGSHYGGLVSTFAPGRIQDVRNVLTSLGSSWELESIAIKPYACMGGLHASIDAVLDLRNEQGIEPGNVESIEISVPKAIYHHGGWAISRPTSVVGAQMNLAYAASVAMLDGAAGIPQFSPDRIGRDDVWAMIERVRIERADCLDQTQGEYTPLAAVVTVKTPRGRWRRAIQSPRGTAARPLTNEEILTKARQLLDQCVDRARRLAIEQAVLGLPDRSEPRGLLDLLTAPVRNPLEAG